MQSQKAVAPAGPYSRFDVSRSFAMPLQPVAEQSHPMASFVQEIQRWTTVATIQRNHTVEFVEKIASSLPVRVLRERTASPMSLALPPVRRKSPQASSQSDEDDSPAATLRERVLRKHRRIETRPFMTARLGTSQSRSAAISEIPTLIHRTPAQPRINPLSESTPRQHSAPQAPNINVAQITDAVLQQLDRRLIAARERMGRI